MSEARLVPAFGSHAQFWCANNSLLRPFAGISNASQSSVLFVFPSLSFRTKSKAKKTDVFFKYIYICIHVFFHSGQKGWPLQQNLPSFSLCKMSTQKNQVSQTRVDVSQSCVACCATINIHSSSGAPTEILFFFSFLFFVQLHYALATFIYLMKVTIIIFQNKQKNKVTNKLLSASVSTWLNYYCNAPKLLLSSLSHWRSSWRYSSQWFGVKCVKSGKHEEKSMIDWRNIKEKRSRLLRNKHSQSMLAESMFSRWWWWWW